LKGKLFNVLSKFFISPRNYLEISQAVGTYMRKDWGDMVTIVFFLKAPFPLARKIYQHRFPDMDPERCERKFKLSKTRRVAQSVYEIAELFGVLYAVEIGLLVLNTLGFQFVRTYSVNQWAGGILASLWGAKSLSSFKSWVVSRGGRRGITKSNGARLINRFGDILIYAATVLAIFDFLSIKTGIALGSLFGLSSVTSLVFTLAARELATEFLSSLAIHGTNIYEEGDLISMQGRALGIVQLGWLNTHV
jgi:small-conductance mechanosensitive channel